MNRKFKLLLLLIFILGPVVVCASEEYVNYYGISMSEEEYSNLLGLGFTEDEIYLMQRVIETEVYGCDFEAKTHVASVIINRIEGDKFPNDATTVCTSPGQFVYSRKQI